MNNCRDLSKKFDANREEQEKTRGVEGGTRCGTIFTENFFTGKF